MNFKQWLEALERKTLLDKAPDSKKSKLKRIAGKIPPTVPRKSEVYD